MVGDQSSGKSSLLESLTGIPFPKDQSLCTRHATQITSRRGNGEHVEVRIMAGPGASEEHKKYVEGFSTKVPSREEFCQQFAEILKRVSESRPDVCATSDQLTIECQANERMGLRSNIALDEGDVFSRDIVKIEMHGPDEDYLTVIDVPGIFRTTTEGTTKEDMGTVRDLVTNYIKDDRTIILAVLPSNVDIATQEILELAEEHDQNGERTLGILTKPDLVLDYDAKVAVCDLVLGRKRPLALGYYVVRNRGPNNGSMEMSQVQKELDNMLCQEPWSNIPPERVGISSLKEQLGPLLRDIAKREFPKLLREVNNEIRKCNGELHSLGPPRQDERQQRVFLSQIAGRFQECVRAALNADYNTNSIFDEGELRLITNVTNITDIFSHDFEHGAHSRRFEHIVPPVATEARAGDGGGDDDGSDDDLDEEESARELLIDNLRNLIDDTGVDDIEEDELAELGDLITVQDKARKSQGSLSEWISDMYPQYRGLDLGTFNPNFVSQAFAEQSRKWGHLTKKYMIRIIVTLHRFIGGALLHVCPDKHTRAQLWNAVLESLVHRYREAMEQADLLVEVELRKKPYTLNRRFNQVLSKSRALRLTELLRPKARKDTKQYGETQYMVNIDDIAKIAEDKSNSEQLQEEIHDILYAYYGLALNRVVDNVFQLAVDHSLLHGPSSPLKVFSHDWVISLECDQLEQIAGEPRFTKKQRTKLMRKVEDLTNALKILRS